MNSTSINVNCSIASCLILYNYRHLQERGHSFLRQRREFLTFVKINFEEVSHEVCGGADGGGGAGNYSSGRSDSEEGRPFY